MKLDMNYSFQMDIQGLHSKEHCKNIIKIVSMLKIVEKTTRLICGTFHELSYRFPLHLRKPILEKIESSPNHVFNTHTCLI